MSAELLKLIEESAEPPTLKVESLETIRNGCLTELELTWTGAGEALKGWSLRFVADKEGATLFEKLQGQPLRSIALGDSLAEARDILRAALDATAKVESDHCESRDQA